MKSDCVCAVLGLIDQIRLRFLLWPYAARQEKRKACAACLSKINQDDRRLNTDNGGGDCGVDENRSRRRNKLIS
jgi:hypothetical protein